MKAWKFIASIVLVLLAAFVGYGAGLYRHAATTPRLSTPYQAVLLTNGQAYFGRLERLGSSYLDLRDVFYIQSQVDQETNEAVNTLVKRGKEWHGPDRMILNADHVLFIEPVTPGSMVAKLIADARTKGKD